MNRKSESNGDRIFVNQAIRSYEVLCIDQNNNNLGKMARNSAIALAQSAGLDLVQVSPGDRNQIPTCRILDSGRYKYDLSKRRKEAEKKQRENSIKEKEIKFRPSTDDNDLRVKAKKAEEFLEEGCRVKVSITFRGREMAHQNVANDTLKTFLSLVANAQVLGRSAMDNRNLVTMLVKKETK